MDDTNIFNCSLFNLLHFSRTINKMIIYQVLNAINLFLYSGQVKKNEGNNV